MTRSAEDEAIDWYDRLKRDRSAETRRAFEAWRAERPENAREFDQQVKLFGTVETLGWTPAQRPAAWSWGRTGVAAGALAAAACVAILIWPSADLPTSPERISPQAQLTRPVRLGDGTLVILAAGAEAVPRFGAEMRRVILSGGPARFIVAADPSRPFVVEAPGVSVHAREGVFDIDPAPRGARVTAITGSVEVSRNRSSAVASETIALAPRQAVDLAGRLLSPEPAAPRARVTVIEADGLSLGDVLRIANETTGPAIALGEPALAQRQVTGRFDVSDHRGLARRLAAALDLSLETRDDRIVLTAR